jgi:LacI family transcriptional regulator
MNMSSRERESWRIAIVWMDPSGRLMEALQAVNRAADHARTISLRHFPGSAPHFTREVVKPLALWRPHGVLVNMLDWEKLKSLRDQLPGVPFVACQAAPKDLVDTCVLMDIEEALRTALDHFRHLGVLAQALYYCGTRILEPVRLNAFREAAPDGFSFTYYHEDQQPGKSRMVPQPDGRLVLEYPHEDRSERVKALQEWLRELPKPAGVITGETGAAGFLLAQCRRLGLRVPEDVQIIGIDDPADCLQCDPHLTSLTPPWSRIGKMAIGTLLRHLRGETQPPLIRVAGSTLAIRGTTSSSPGGRARTSAAILQLADEMAVRGLSAKELAQLSGMGRSAFFEQFTAATGQTPARYLRAKQMKEARLLLRETTASVESVAQKCGFSSIYSFSRSFRRETGQSPTAYRRRTVDTAAGGDAPASGLHR